MAGIIPAGLLDGQLEQQRFDGPGLAVETLGRGQQNDGLIGLGSGNSGQLGDVISNLEESIGRRRGDQRLASARRLGPHRPGESLSGRQRLPPDPRGQEECRQKHCDPSIPEHPILLKRAIQCAHYDISGSEAVGFRCYRHKEMGFPSAPGTRPSASPSPAPAKKQREHLNAKDSGDQQIDAAGGEHAGQQ